MVIYSPAHIINITQVKTREKLNYFYLKCQNTPRRTCFVVVGYFVRPTTQPMSRAARKKSIIFPLLPQERFAGINDWIHARRNVVVVPF